MTTTESVRPMPARAVALGGSSDETLAAEMAGHLPQDGMACPRMQRQPSLPRLPRSAYRLLDSRILAVAVGFLDEDIAHPLLAGLTTCRALVAAARETSADPDRGEVLVTLTEPYEITSTHHPYVALVVDGTEVDRVVFTLEIVMRLCETAVVVRRGAIEAVSCDVCALDLTFALADRSDPLLRKHAELPVRLAVRPPVLIPLPEVTRMATTGSEEAGGDGT